MPLTWSARAVPSGEPSAKEKWIKHLSRCVTVNLGPVMIGDDRTP